MSFVPRAEIDKVMQRYGDHLAGRNDLPVDTVRQIAADCRRYAERPGTDSQDSDEIRAEADDLDALADRYA